MRSLASKPTSRDAAATATRPGARTGTRPRPSGRSSSLDLLTERQRRRYGNFAWDAADYLCGTAGRNENPNCQMLHQLGGVRPERRANSTADAVVNQGSFSDAVDRHITGNLVEIPQFPEPEEEGATRPFQATSRELYYTAHDAFLRMRAAALADGVVLRVRAAYREPEESQRRAAAADNDNAVAEFSSHNPGLAIDLQMGHRWQDPEDQSHRQRFAEATTTPMQNVIDMRESPVRKWMFLHGAEYGWFPFQQEPWHWEYNPEGFHDEFAANVAAEEEAAAAAAAEAAARARENRENHEPEEQPEE